MLALDGLATLSNASAAAFRNPGCWSLSIACNSGTASLAEQIATASTSAGFVTDPVVERHHFRAADDVAAYPHPPFPRSASL